MLESSFQVTQTSVQTGKFEARFFHLIFEEEFARVKGHFGPINTIAIHPDGKRSVKKFSFFSCTSNIYLVTPVEVKMVLCEYITSIMIISIMILLIKSSLFFLL